MDDSGDKLYYKISEVAEMLDVPVSTIRFWEKEFKELKPVRRLVRSQILQAKRY